MTITEEQTERVEKSGWIKLVKSALENEAYYDLLVGNSGYSLATSADPVPQLADLVLLGLHVIKVKGQLDERKVFKNLERLLDSSSNTLSEPGVLLLLDYLAEYFEYRTKNQLLEIDTTSLIDRINKEQLLVPVKDVRATPNLVHMVNEHSSVKLIF